MTLHLNLRVFRLADGGVSCGAEGLFVGRAPMLRRRRSEEGGGWAARSVTECDEALSEVYGLPVDSSGKQAGFVSVARALDRGDLPLAAIAAVLLRFPDPPALTKDAPPRASPGLAAELAAEGLLKADWDSSKHPRLGGPPNPGWFAATEGSSPPALPETLTPASRSVADATSTDAGAQAGAWTWRRVLTATREALNDAGESAVKTGRFALWSDPELKLAIEVAIEALSSTPLMPDEQRTIDQTNASFDPPKTLAELRERPTRFLLGYERHHIVEQNPANLLKSPLTAWVVKFGRAALEGPGNIVWIPRTRHELITGFYNAKDPNDLQGRIRRRLISEMSFDDQYRTGLAAMQLFGVLE